MHRAMRAETRRLAALAAEQGDLPFPPEREAALRRHLGHLLAEVHGHHTKEDTVLWPVIAAAAGAAIDLGPLTDDHNAIEPCLAAVRDGRGVARAKALADLRDLLDEHITDEEATVFPVVRRYVTAADWKRCEQRMARGASLAQLRWTLPYLASHCAPDDLAVLTAQAGPVFRLLLRLTRPSYERLQRAVYGAG